MRIVVMGVGGVGGYFGARLARSGASVTFVARGEHAKAIRERGLRVRSTVEGEYVVHAPTLESLVGEPSADLVLFCVKTFDTEKAIETIRPVIGADTAVLPLQNGVDNVEKIDGLLGAGHTLGGAAYVFATVEAPGVIDHRAGGRIIFGELDGQVGPRSGRIRTAFEGAGVPIELSREVQRVLWEKYLMICAQAGMTALTRCSSGVIRQTAETWRMYRMIVEELATLAAASGVTLVPDVVTRIVTSAERLAPETFSSLHYDLTHGRGLELETLHGHAVRLGERLGVATPMVFAVYAALKPYVKGSGL